MIRKYEHAGTYLAQITGLMFKPPLINKALIYHFPQPVKHSFHTFFVFHPIDIIWVGEDMTIIHTHSRVPPFTLSLRCPQPYHYVIEAPPGTIQEYNIQAGQPLPSPIQEGIMEAIQ